MLSEGIYPICRIVKDIFRYGIIFPLIILVFCACGRKAPPVLTTGPITPPPAVSDLGYVIQEDQLDLIWSLAAESLADFSDIQGFRIYRASLAASGETCDGCPRIFEPIADVPLLPYTTLTDGRCQWHFPISASAGTQDAYKLKVLLINHRLGPDSNIMELRP